MPTAALDLPLDEFPLDCRHAPLDLILALERDLHGRFLWLFAVGRNQALARASFTAVVEVTLPDDLAALTEVANTPPTFELTGHVNGWS